MQHVSNLLLYIAIGQHEFSINWSADNLEWCTFHMHMCLQASNLAKNTSMDAVITNPAARGATRLIATSWPLALAPTCCHISCCGGLYKFSKNGLQNHIWYRSQVKHDMNPVKSGVSHRRRNDKRVFFCSFQAKICRLWIVLVPYREQKKTWPVFFFPSYFFKGGQTKSPLSLIY